MDYIVYGGMPLQGEIALSGAKNVALKLLIAGLLLEGKTTLHNVPRIADVMGLIEIINYLGPGSVNFIGDNSLTVENKLKLNKIPLEYSAKTRTSFMLIAPLLYTFGEAIIPNPGGCRIGARPVDRLVKSVQEFGAVVGYNSEDGYYYANLKSPKSAQVQFLKKTHTGTELALMMAARVPGESVIKNVALEPEIDDLINLLRKSGANIEKKQEDIYIKGSEKLQGAEVTVSYDRNEAVSFIILSVLFQGSIAVKNVDMSQITAFLEKLAEAGVQYSYDESKKLFRALPTTKIMPVNVTTAPHPGFMTDWQPMWALLMTQAEGMSTIHETVFEDRFGYVSELNKLGAKIEYYDPQVKDPSVVYQFNWTTDHAKKQAVEIHGPKVLHEGAVQTTDIRAGASVLLAALCPKGKSVVSGVEQLERGYEKLVEKLIGLGAHIEKVQHNTGLA